MSNKFIKYILIISFFLISNCGFKVMDKTKGNNFQIEEINLTGDTKVNFNIRNNLLLQFNNESENNLILDIETNKSKSIKEKTRNNRISKFQIEISIKGRINFIEQVNTINTVNYNYIIIYRNIKIGRHERHHHKAMSLRGTRNLA